MKHHLCPRITEKGVPSHCLVCFFIAIRLWFNNLNSVEGFKGFLAIHANTSTLTIFLSKCCVWGNPILFISCIKLFYNLFERKSWTAHTNLKDHSNR